MMPSDPFSPSLSHSCSLELAPPLSPQTTSPGVPHPMKTTVSWVVPTRR